MEVPWSLRTMKLNSSIEQTAQLKLLNTAIPHVVFQRHPGILKTKREEQN